MTGITLSTCTGEMGVGSCILSDWLAPSSGVRVQCDARQSELGTASLFSLPVQKRLVAVK